MNLFENLFTLYTACVLLIGILITLYIAKRQLTLLLDRIECANRPRRKRIFLRITGVHIKNKNQLKGQ